MPPICILLPRISWKSNLHEPLVFSPAGHSHDVAQMTGQGKVNFQQLERELRRKHFGILSTVTADNRSHSTGVLYGVSPVKRPLAVYITTRSGNRKIRNIRANPNVSFVVPLPHRVLGFVPPSCIQFQGTAEVREFSDGEAVETFRSSRFLRMILRVESEIASHEAACFIRITPDPVLFTYGLGVPVWRLRGRAGQAASRVSIPPERTEEL